MIFVFGFGLSACSSEINGTELPKIVVSTSIIGDVAEKVNGDAFDIEILLSAGVDPHGYQPTPKDVAAIIDADLVLINGYGLEEFLSSILNENDLSGKIVIVSEGVDVNQNDPHVWMDPMNVVIWVENITDAFAELQPDNEAEFRENSRDYIRDLNELDNWIFETIEQMPVEGRVLISDHLSLGYFAERYGFEQAAAISHSASSLAEPSALELAELIDLIVELGIPAIFVGHDVNPDLANSLSEDLGIDLIELYIGSLSSIDGPAGTYLDLMRFNVDAIVSALK